MKIAIIKDGIDIGGITTSLLNFLNYLNQNHKNVKVDLYIIKDDENVILPENTHKIIIKNRMLFSAEIVRTYFIENKKFFGLFLKCVDYAMLKIMGYRKFYNFIIGKKKYKPLYDYAICYCQDKYSIKFSKFANQFTLNKFNAKQKITWLHSDVDHTDFDFDDLEKIYSNFDKVVCVSKANALSLEKKLPSLKDKITVEYNHYDTELINKKAEEYIPFTRDEGKKYLVTVSRLSTEKGIDRAINIIKRLIKENRTDFFWHFVGDGIDDYSCSKLNMLLKEKKLDSYACFVGNKQNPYPYIKKSDIFVFPTRAEACPMVVDESISLKTFVLTCYYPASTEQITSPKFGKIVNNDENSLYEALKEML